MTDPARIAKAAAKMRRPEIHMHPDSVEQLMTVTERSSGLVPPAGIAIVADEGVEPGHMWLVDAEPEPFAWTPTPIGPDVLEAIDRHWARASSFDQFLAGKLLEAELDSCAASTVDPSSVFSDTARSLHAGAMLGMALGHALSLGIDRSALRPRRPWRIVGRAATRARWRRQGRR